MIPKPCVTAERRSESERMSGLASTRHRGAWVSRRRRLARRQGHGRALDGLKQWRGPAASDDRQAIAHRRPFLAAALPRLANLGGASPGPALVRTHACRA